MFRIGPFTFTLVGTGSGKSLDRYPHKLDTIDLFRQDCIATSFKNDVLIVIVADGHGPEPHGSMFSSIASKFVIDGIHAQLSSIRNICTDKTALHTFMTKMFTDIDNYLYNHYPETKSISTGGSTLTVNVKMLHPSHKNKLVSFTCNVGDSPMVRVSGDRIKFISQDLNADKLEHYQHHIDYCNKYGTTPQSAIIGRLNTYKGYATPWMGPLGTTIKPYVISKIDGKWVAKLNQEILERFHVNASQNYKLRCLSLGGSQSIRDRKDFLNQVKRAKLGLDTYPEYNFGNTVSNLQCLPGSCFGDRNSKGTLPKLLINTTVEIWERGNRNNEIEFICSDGIIDVLDDDAIINACNATSYSSKYTCNSLYNRACIEACGGKFPFKNNKPSWDDLSIITIKTKMVKTISKHRKSNKKRKAKRLAQKKRHKHH